MAKYECRLNGEFDKIIGDIESSILGGSISASLEDKSDLRTDTFRCAVRVFERYSMLGKNRVSLSVTLVGSEDELFLSAITSGGSQAVFFKVNIFGEEAFLERLIQVAEKYRQ